MGGELKVPTVLAVVAWAASGLCVLSYTYLAYKESSSSNSGHTKTPLSGNQQILNSQLLQQIKPLERGKFNTNGQLKAP